MKSTRRKQSAKKKRKSKGIGDLTWGDMSSKTNKKLKPAFKEKW